MEDPDFEPEVTDFEPIGDIEELTEPEIEELEAFLRLNPPAWDVPQYRICRSRSSPTRWRLVPATILPGALKQYFDKQQDTRADHYTDIARKTSNPIFMWKALSSALEEMAGQRASDASPLDTIVLPRHLVAYLQDCAVKLLNLCSEAQPRPENGSLQKMIQEIPRIFGFSSQGTNAFERYHVIMELLEDFSIQSTAVLLGASAKEGYALVQKKRGLANERQAQRRVAEGRDLSGGEKRVPGRSAARRNTKVT